MKQQMEDQAATSDEQNGAGDSSTEQEEPTNCAVCEKRLVFSWTDTHGIAQCCSCGVPYTLYHYENDKRVNKPSECLVLPEWIPLLRRYISDTGHLIPSNCSFPGGQELAQPADFHAFNEWCDSHRAELPARVTG